MVKQEASSFFALGGHNEILTRGLTRTEHELVCAESQREIARIEAKYSRYKQDSVLSKINAKAAKQSVPLDAETLLLLRYADEAFRISNGTFDITTGILRRAWDFTAAIIPQPEAVAALRSKIGWNNVTVSDAGVSFAQPGIELDLGGIGKEYAADRVRELLRHRRVPAASVNLGGDISVYCATQESQPWKIGIRHPRERGRTLGVIVIPEGSIATSGDYERFFIHEGKRYCHILDPRTGYPATDFQAVTIVAGSCLVAGTLATSVMVLGQVSGRELLMTQGVQHLVVTREGEIWNGLSS